MAQYLATVEVTQEQAILIRGLYGEGTVRTANKFGGQRLHTYEPIHYFYSYWVTMDF